MIMYSMCWITFVTTPVVKETVGLLVLSSLAQECGQSSRGQHHAGRQKRLQSLHNLGSRISSTISLRARLSGWGARWPGLHQHGREGMCPWLPVLEGGEFKLQHLQCLDVIARLKVLKVFLLQ